MIKYALALTPRQRCRIAERRVDVESIVATARSEAVNRNRWWLNVTTGKAHERQHKVEVAIVLSSPNGVALVWHTRVTYYTACSRERTVNYVLQTSAGGMFHRPINDNLRKNAWRRIRSVFSQHISPLAQLSASLDDVPARIFADEEAPYVCPS